MDIVLNSRHCELTDRFRSHVEEKLARLEKHDHRVIRVEVEVEAERNPRQADRAVRVELTAFSKGPVVRAEAAADDKMSALDIALDKLVNRATDGLVGEVVLATNFTNEGEATAHYISEMLKARGLKVSRLARGVPVGGELEYVDAGTIARAMLDRRST